MLFIGASKDGDEESKGKLKNLLKKKQ